MLLALTRVQTATRLGEAAAAALGAWLVMLALLAVATRPRRPRAGPAAMDFPGDEPPAVVGLLTNGWEVGRSAVPATLLDLAARKILSIDAVGPDRFLCRLRRTRPGAGSAGLTPYEEQVLDHVRRLAASDGTVACEALTTGPQAQSSGWWKSFSSAVIKDAEDRNLARARWSGGIAWLIAVTALVPAVLGALALVVLPDQHHAASGSSSDGDPVGTFFGVFLVIWVLLMVLPRSLRAERDTTEGLRVASGWLGLREHLHQDGTFGDAPPAAVAIWDRYLSYGAALGVAAAAVRALPLGSESDNEAWSAYGGRWHMVRIRYPRWIPPGYGRHPVTATLIAAANLAIAVAGALVLDHALGSAGSRFIHTVRVHGLQPITLLGLFAFGVPLVGVAVWVVRSAAMLVTAVPDVVARREVEGVALRVFVHSMPYLAVDDGRHGAVRAWLVDETLLSEAIVSPGDLVSATISPRLNHVFRLERSRAPAPRA